MKRFGDPLRLLEQVSKNLGLVDSCQRSDSTARHTVLLLEEAEELFLNLRDRLYAGHRKILAYLHSPEDD